MQRTKGQQTTFQKQHLRHDVAMGQKPGYLPVNIPIPTKIGPKMGGAPTPTWDPIGFDPQPRVQVSALTDFSTPVWLSNGRSAGEQLGPAANHVLTSRDWYDCPRSTARLPRNFCHGHFRPGQMGTWRLQEQKQMVPVLSTQYPQKQSIRCIPWRVGSCTVNACLSIPSARILNLTYHL